MVSILQKSDGLSATLRAKRDSAPLMRIMVEPDSSWVICCIYKKRQRAPPVVIPPVIGDVGEAIIPHAIGDAREGQLHFIDFLGQPARNDPSSPHSCTIDPSSLEEGSDESAGDGEYNDGDGMNEANWSSVKEVNWVSRIKTASMALHSMEDLHASYICAFMFKLENYVCCL